MDAVSEYKERRRARLDALAIHRYKERRDARLGRRMDADEEENNSSSGGHGNTKIPFGLCQREGIAIDPKWSPKDAWEALAGKGYSAGDVYKELKDTGKVASRAKKATTKLDSTHFPHAMTTPTYKGNTMEFAKYVNAHCDDPEVTEFLSLSMGKGAKVPGDIRCRRTTRHNTAAVTCAKYVSTGMIAHATVTIPNFSKISDPEQKKEAVRTFAHEWTHFIDLCARGKDTYGHFTSKFEPLKQAIAKDDGSIGAEAKKLFDDYNAAYDKVRKRGEEDKKAARVEMAIKDYGADGEKPVWVRDDGYLDYATAIRKGVARSTMLDYEKKARKLSKEIDLDNRDERAALMDGVSTLQGLYDSLNGGKLRASGATKWGHDLKYFRSDPDTKGIEMLADYVALKVTSPKLAEVFRKDKPEIAKQLDAEIAEITKKLRGS